MRFSSIPIALSLALGTATPLAAHPRQDAGTPREASTPPLERLGRELAAFGPESELTFSELDDLLIWRNGNGEDGRAARDQLLELRVLEALEKSERVEVTARMLEEKMDELDASIKASGDPGGLVSYLASSGVDSTTFRDYLRLGIVHEVLARRSLGTPDGDPLSGEQQTMWLREVMNERGYELGEHPYEDSFVARCGDVRITRAEFARHLRQQLPQAELEENCYQLLLAKRVVARMPDLAPEAIDRAIEAEIARRRLEMESNPTYQGMPYEQLLGARGLSLEAIRRDPAIRVAALAHLWVNRSITDESMRAFYEAERDIFDGRFGPGVEAAVLVLKGARFINDLVPRTFEQAELEALELRSLIDGPADFGRLARQRSEDLNTRDKGGAIGLVMRNSPAVPETIRDAIFEVLDRETGSVTGRVLGPVRVQGGVALVCLGARRPAPTWDEMSQYVHTELRRRFLEESLAEESVVTWTQEG